VTVQDEQVEETPAAVASEIARLYSELGARLWRSLLAYSGDPDMASDIMSEAFAQLLRRGSAVRDPERWLWRSAFKIAAGEMRRARQDEPLIDGGHYDLEEPAIDLMRALRDLSPHQRASVVLHHAAGYPVVDVARILASTPAAVKVHLMRGRRRLRALLGEEGPP
jgi:RNA polymerase sigma-70 factor (ECF subfamily)